MTVNPIGRIAKIGAVLGAASDIARRGRGAAKVVGTIFEHLGKRGPYKALQKLTKGKKGAIQAHHILEVRFLERWGHKAAEGPAVILSKVEHNQITQALRQKLPYGMKKDESVMSQVREAYREVYTKYGHSDWLQDIEHYFP